MARTADIWKTVLIVFIVGSLSTGCPMDVTDNSLRGQNNSQATIRFAVKHSGDANILTWADINPGSESSIPLVNRYWDDVFYSSADSISIYCVRTTWWDSIKNWNQVNSMTALKYEILSRSDLESIHWTVVYP